MSAKTLQEAVLQDAKIAWGFLSSHKMLVFLILLTLLPWIPWLWLSVRGSMQRQVTLYAGKPTGDGALIGDIIAKYLNSHTSNFFTDYQVEVKPTKGFARNRELIQNSKPGTLAIGFDHDGFNPPDNVRTLLPLNDAVMHIIGNKEDLLKDGQAKLEKDAQLDGPVARKFGEFANTKGKNGKARKYYLGPEGSGARQVAMEILLHYNVDYLEVDAGSHLAWDTAFQQLMNSEIDLIFTMADLGSPTIIEKAKSGKFMLVGLDDVSGLAAGRNSMRPLTVPRNSYSFGSGFCPTDVQTVCTRRIIICPNTMSDFDAFYLAAEIRDALRQVAPNISWNQPVKNIPDPGLIVPLHQGAMNYKDNREPWLRRVLDSFWGPIFSLASGIVMFLYLGRPRRNTLTDTAEPSPPAEADAVPEVKPDIPAAASAGSPSIPEPLRRLIDDFAQAVDSLGKERTPLSDRDYRVWKERIRRLRDRLADLRLTLDAKFQEDIDELHGQLGILETELAIARNSARQPDAGATPSPARSE